MHTNARRNTNRELNGGFVGKSTVILFTEVNPAALDFRTQR